jgi:hypothetical protein
MIEDRSQEKQDRYQHFCFWLPAGSQNTLIFET